MTHQTASTLPEQDIREWHDRIATSSNDVLSRIVALLKGGDPEQILLRLLNDKTTCSYFSTPEGKPWRLPGAEDDASRAERQRWGRRVSYYLRTFLDGLETLDRRKEVSLPASVESLRRVLEEFDITYQTAITTTEELRKSLHPQPHVEILVGHFISYVDPLLYSCLIYLRQLERQYKPECIPDGLQQVLLSRVASELKRCLLDYDGDPSIQVPFSDSASIWWAIYTLLDLQGEDMSVGEEKGYEGAARLCLRLLEIESLAGGLITPSTDRKRWLDATPEIYDHLRTRMLVVLNCLYLQPLVTDRWPSSLIDTLGRTVSDHFDRLRHEEAIFHNLHRMGVACQLSSRLMSLLDDERGPIQTPSRQMVATMASVATPGAFLLPGLRLFIDGEEIFMNAGADQTVVEMLVVEKRTRGPELTSMVKNAHEIIRKLISRNPTLKQHVQQTKATDNKTHVYTTHIQDLTRLLICDDCNRILPLVCLQEGQSPEPWKCSTCRKPVQGVFVSDLPQFDCLGGVYRDQADN